MKKFFNKVAAMAVAVVAMGTSVFAQGTLMGEFETELSKDRPLGQVLQMMFMAFQFIGVAVVIFGAVQMGFAFKNDDADGKSKGMRAALSGAIVFIIGAGASWYFNGITIFDITW